MRDIFFNKDSEKAITRKGYAVLQNFLPEESCNTLIDFFEQNDTIDARAFTISNWNDNAEHRNLVFKKITETLLPFSTKYLNAYKPVMGVFTVKRSGLKSDMLLHQDWTLVDETKFRSVSVWVALCDMNRDNGNLQVAEGSHIYAGFPRGMNVPVPFENIRSKIHESHLTDLPLKKGDAIVFDHRLIHASPENNSNKIRVAAVMALIPAEADLIHYYKHQNSNSECEVLKMDTSEFAEVDFFDIPNKPKHRTSLGTVPAVFRQISLDEINQAKR